DRKRQRNFRNRPAELLGERDAKDAPGVDRAKGNLQEHPGYGDAPAIHRLHKFPSLEDGLNSEFDSGFFRDKFFPNITSRSLNAASPRRKSRFQKVLNSLKRPGGLASSSCAWTSAL